MFLMCVTDLNLKVVAMALAGFADEKNTLWKDTCGSIGPSLSHPYLRAMFAFLTTEGEIYDTVLVSKSLFLYP